eukprot:6471596-Amphidinium_carterae.2
MHHGVGTCPMRTLKHTPQMDSKETYCHRAPCKDGTLTLTSHRMDPPPNNNAESRVQSNGMRRRCTKTHVNCRVNKRLVLHMLITLREVK